MRRKRKETLMVQKKDGRSKKKKTSVVAISLLAVLLIAGIGLLGRGFGKNSEEIEAPEDTPSVVLADQDIVIPINELSETAKFYPMDIDGTRLEVVAVKASDGSIRTAFNTCQVCYDSGNGYYKQQGDVLICQNCGNKFPMDRVEVEAGGCNPWPIFEESKAVTADTITLSYDFLKESKGIFSNWKQSY